MIKYFLNNIECNPVDKEDINYIFNFNDRLVRELEIDTDSLTFVREDFKRINDWRSNYGDFVGMPLKIQYDSSNYIDYILDFSDGFENSTNSCSVKIKRYKGIDNFFDNANGLSFEQVPFNDYDFHDIDYLIIKPDQLPYFISLSITTFTLTQEIIQSIKDIAENIKDITKAAIPTGIPPSPNLPDIVGSVIMLAARIAYAIAIIIALIK